MFHALIPEKPKKVKPTMTEYLQASEEASRELQSTIANNTQSAGPAAGAPAANPFAALLGQMGAIGGAAAQASGPSRMRRMGTQPVQPSNDQNIISGFDFNVIDSEINEMEEEAKRLARDADRAKRMEIRQRVAQARTDGDTGNFLAALPTGDAEAEEFTEMVMEITQGDTVLHDGKRRKTHLRQKVSQAKGLARQERVSAHASGMTYKSQLQKSKQQNKKKLSW
jgi:hypothetical protein